MMDAFEADFNCSKLETSILTEENIEESPNRFKRKGSSSTNGVTLGALSKSARKSGEADLLELCETRSSLLGCRSFAFLAFCG